MVRYYGYYSNVSRGKRNKEQELLQEELDPKLEIDTFKKMPKSVRKSWARLISKVYEVDPLLCPKCGGEMKIQKMVTDPNEIQATLIALGMITNTRDHPPEDNKMEIVEYDLFPENDYYDF